MDYVKIGIIGIGNMGSNHVKFVGDMKNAKLTAVCDINEAAFNRIDEKVRANIECFTNSDEFFAEADVDMVVIAVPHYDHVPLAIKALEAGKHIVVEKPISVHKLEAERLIEEAKKISKLEKITYV